jgi:formylglycine-generating enzyme required for sulfatase activity
MNKHWLIAIVAIVAFGCTESSVSTDYDGDKDNTVSESDTEGFEDEAEQNEVSETEPEELGEDEFEFELTEEAPERDTTPNTWTDEFGITWRILPEGWFTMGCSEGDDECRENEFPRHLVSIDSFAIMVTEVTQNHYKEVMGENPSHFIGCPQCPVEQVTWDMAKSFCQAVGGRLPSESEWEYAARAGTTSKYTCGNDPECLDYIAWYSENSDNMTHPVAQLEPNAWGLYDMMGNTWEWVEDCYHSDYEGAPDDGSVWRNENCEEAAMRSSSYSLGAFGKRSSYRDKAALNYTNRYSFRCAMDF